VMHINVLGGKGGGQPGGVIRKPIKGVSENFIESGAICREKAGLRKMEKKKKGRGGSLLLHLEPYRSSGWKAPGRARKKTSQKKKKKKKQKKKREVCSSIKNIKLLG